MEMYKGLLCSYKGQVFPSAFCYVHAHFLTNVVFPMIEIHVYTHDFSCIKTELEMQQILMC